MISLAADTHVIIWLVRGDSKLSNAARTSLRIAQNDGEQVAISTMTPIEMVQLIERQRLSPVVLEKTLELLGEPDPWLVEFPINRRIFEAFSGISKIQIPETPDRIIAATAVHLGVPLITSDDSIRKSRVITIW